MGGRRNKSQLIRAAWVLLTVFYTGCGDLRGGNGGSTAVAATDHLIGSWDARFRLAAEFQPQSSTTNEVTGRLLFVGIKSAASSFPDLATPVDYGLHDIDFSPFGFDLRAAGVVPTAIGRDSPVPGKGVDSLFIVLDPERRGVVVLMRGQLRGDRAEGLWTAISPTRSGIGESGSFAMTRVRSGQN